MATLSDLFLTALGDSKDSIVEGGTCTEWDATSYENVVFNGAARYENLPVVNPAAMSEGTQVLLLKTPNGRLILGPLVRSNTTAS